MTSRPILLRIFFVLCHFVGLCWDLAKVGYENNAIEWSIIGLSRVSIIIDIFFKLIAEIYLKVYRRVRLYRPHILHEYNE